MLASRFSRPAGSSPAEGLVQDQHRRLHGDDARQGHPALLSAGEFKGGFVQLVVRIPTSLAASRTQRSSSSPVFPHAGRAKGDVLRRFPQRADTPDTGTPAPPENGHCGSFWGSSHMSRPLSRICPEVGLSRPLRCWIRGRFSGTGMADDPPKFSPVPPLKAHILPRRCGSKGLAYAVSWVRCFDF